MRLMRLMPIYQKPDTSMPAKWHKTYSYLLGGLLRVGLSSHQRPHTAYGGQPPAVVIETDQQVQAVA